MQIVIDIDENLYIRLFDNGDESVSDMSEACTAIRKGIPLDEIRAEAISRKINYTDSNRDTYRRGINDVLKIIDEIMGDIYDESDGEVYEKIKEIIAKVKEQGK
jgi:hypothetical protein